MSWVQVRRTRLKMGSRSDVSSFLQHSIINLHVSYFMFSKNLRINLPSQSALAICVKFRVDYLLLGLRCAEVIWGKAGNLHGISVSSIR
jgi:hypothetical protein